MINLRVARLRVAGIAALATSALVLAACGSASSSSTTTATAAPAASSSTTPASSSTAAAAPSTGTTIGTAQAHGQTFLTGASGRAIYLWVADTGDKSSCSGACAKAWPPVLTKGKPAAGSGVTASDLGTTMRDDGTEEVTYKGHPLYYFVADKSAGQTLGQGSDSFGAKWWLVAPSGAAITTGGSTGGASSSSGGSSTSSSSGGWG